MANEAKLAYSKIEHLVKMKNVNTKGMNKVAIQIRCDCTHHDANGAINLAPPTAGGPKGKFSDMPLYRCRTCNEMIDIAPVDQESFERAVDEINRICDVTKMRIDFKSERDLKIIEQIREFQYDANVLLRDAYNISTKQQKKKQKQNKPFWGGMARTF